MSRGWWTVARFRGAPIRLHWTLPIGAFVMGRFAFIPAFWLGFLVLILAHELGHALLVLRYRLGLTEIAIHGMGGYCRHQRSGTRFEQAVVAWGGVAAQATLLLASYAWLLVFGRPQSAHSALLFHVFTSTNLLIICINLLPIEPLDGKKAWSILGILRDRWRSPSSSPGQGPSERRSVNDELRAIEGLDTQESASDRTDRIVRELVERTTKPKRDR